MKRPPILNYTCNLVYFYLKYELVERDVNLHKHILNIKKKNYHKLGLKN